MQAVNAKDRFHVYDYGEYFPAISVTSYGQWIRTEHSNPKHMPKNWEFVACT